MPQEKPNDDNIKKRGRHDKAALIFLTVLWILILIGGMLIYSHDAAQEGIDAIGSVVNEFGSWSGS